MKQSYELIPVDGQAINASGIQQVLSGIRPHWQGKNLIHRVAKLLPVDPSSACQRLFNAAVHDLKDKIIVMGVDLAKEVASNNRLPSINREEDILDYNVSKTIDLAYYIGLLTRPEWRRIHRCYEIRRDLEHEDNEYEAVLEDCFYIFKCTIDIVLSRDPVELLKVVDVKALVESPNHININEEFVADYKSAPKLRQQEINLLLISYSFDDSKPDIIRENSIELLRKIRSLTDNTVKIELARSIENKFGRGNIDLKSAKIAYACGAIAYFKKVKLIDFYNRLFEELSSASDWNNQGKICQKIEDIGGLKYCPDEIYENLLKQLVFIFIGEKSYGQNSQYRSVFFSNLAVPIVSRMVKEDSVRAAIILDKLRSNKKLKTALEYRPIANRYENLVDLTEIVETDDE